jgi:uncharacterized membrane protein
VKLPYLYQVHPAIVHFPIALLSVGAAVAAARLRRSSPQWLSLAESALLWLGTLMAWAALGFGLLAEAKAPHKPLAWEVLADHKTLAFWTCGVFSAFSLLRLWTTSRAHDADRWRRVQLLLWLAGLALLVATADHGGLLVYDFGMGLSP